MNMRTFFRSVLPVSILALLFCSVLSGGPPGRSGSDKILEFDKMAGVPRPYTGVVNAIRGVAGGGLPWVVDRAKGELHVDGTVEVVVEGLVLDPDDSAVISLGLAGINPVPFFKSVVSCLSRDDMGNATIVNVETGLFPADAGGNSKIEDFVVLPVPCIAPIIFVTSPGGSWFSATGF